MAAVAVPRKTKTHGETLAKCTRFADTARMAYLLLLVAILAEVTATSALKQSDGFTRPRPTLIAAIGYGIAFYFLSLTLRTLPTGIAYAVWSGVGIVLVTAVAWIWQGQRPDGVALAGMALIVAGVLVMNLFSAHAHG